MPDAAAHPAESTSISRTLRFPEMLRGVQSGTFTANQRHTMAIRSVIMRKDSLGIIIDAIKPLSPGNGTLAQAIRRARLAMLASGSVIQIKDGDEDSQYGATWEAGVGVGTSSAGSEHFNAGLQAAINQISDGDGRTFQVNVARTLTGTFDKRQTGQAGGRIEVEVMFTQFPHGHGTAESVGLNAGLAAILLDDNLQHGGFRHLSMSMVYAGTVIGSVRITVFSQD